VQCLLEVLLRCLRVASLQCSLAFLNQSRRRLHRGLSLHEVPTQFQETGKKEAWSTVDCRPSGFEGRFHQVLSRCIGLHTNTQFAGRRTYAACPSASAWRPLSEGSSACLTDSRRDASRIFPPPGSST